MIGSASDTPAVLQWGRGSSPAETSPAWSTQMGRSRASMGPREFTRGDCGSRPSSWLSTSRFNGAAGVHPRRRGSRYHALGCVSALQWGRGSSPAETRWVTLQQQRGTRASMGPREFTRGDQFLFLGANIDVMLQWGRGSSPAETPGRRSGPTPRRSLQWGRGSSPAETTSQRRRPRRSGRASMGPREFTRGDPAISAFVKRRPSMLQWGRGSSPAETRSCSSATTPTSRLQWGRGSSPAETTAW